MKRASLALCHVSLPPRPKYWFYFKTLSCISFILQQNIAIYASNELLMSNFGIYLQLKPLRYGVDEKKNQMTSQCRINARGYIRHWPNLVMVYRVTFMQSFNTRSSCSIKATMPQYYIEAYNIDTKNLGFLNADITSYLCKKVFSSKHIVTWKIATMNSIFWIGCKDIQNLPNKFQL